MQFSTKLKGSLAISCGAAVWGLFWIPLRYLDNHGLHGLWSVSLIMLAALVFVIGIKIWRKAPSSGERKWFWMLGIAMGSSMAFYFSALIMTDVIRATFLFYLLPVWATIFGYLLLGDQISRRKFLAIFMALAGLYLLLGGDGGLPQPENAGDWFAIFSGILWALSLTLIRKGSISDPIENTTAPFLFGAPIALLMTFIIHVYFATNTGATIPPIGVFISLIPISLLFAAVILLPSMFAQIWGARFVAPSSASLLTMTEIIFATVSAWLLIGTNMTNIALLGGLIIIASAVLDITGDTQTDQADTQPV